jgi:hypothetical protein
VVLEMAMPCRSPASAVTPAEVPDWKSAWVVHLWKFTRSAAAAGAALRAAGPLGAGCVAVVPAPAQPGPAPATPAAAMTAAQVKALPARRVRRV